MSYIISEDGENVQFSFNISMSDLLFHIKHSADGEITEEQIQNYFKTNPGKLDTYLDLCENLAEDFMQQQLDEYLDIQEFSKELAEEILEETA